ncbi:AAA family ATPase [Limibaculum sp. M0105]|uniref:AAA family ATPase n=1 Tax=Thermohalobaculum xanthum TaxID=2753746 RepID=A0A8J7M4V5_9RHOB|nr:AAA family ATPase [Thermohalobaculum xanthum]MBK0398185.1 AAA family ATPase [Thermohalobaculum xanthum]
MDHRVDGSADNSGEAIDDRPIPRLAREISAGLVGLETLVERLLIALLAGGHVLIEGAPGLAKTRAVKRLAGALSEPFGRVQCTPDLMPADLIGMQVFRRGSETFDFIAGPIFNALVLVDEINRAPPKVQSALLEAMAEGQVTTGGETRRLPELFMVAATQNPIEHEGTFPLPEAQLDRFMMRVDLTFPGKASELAILDMVESELLTQQLPVTHPVMREDVLKAREDVARVHLSPALKDHIVRLVIATREREAHKLGKNIAHPVSPRGSLALAAAVRARAYLRGRDHGLPEDVVDLAPDILAHRLALTWQAEAEGLTTRDVIARLLDHVRPY